jgi:hypothetical protein
MSVKDNYEKAYGLSLSSSPKTDSEERLRDLTEALNKISKAAQSCGVSMQSMVATINAFASTGMDLSTSTDVALKKVSNRIDEERYLETVQQCAQQVEKRQPDFDIPRLDMDDFKVETNESLFNFKPYEPMQVLSKLEEKKPIPNLKPATKGVIIKLRRDTEENCAKSNLVLHEGEMCLVQKPDGNYYAVIGDGESRILDCPHLTIY